MHCSFVERSTDDTPAHRDKVGHRIDLGIDQSESSITSRSLGRTYTGIRIENYLVAPGGSVHETGIRWDVHTFPLVGHTQKL